MRLSQPLAASRFARARWLVLAPHADDETLGAGALVWQTATSSRFAGVVYLTDGRDRTTQAAAGWHGFVAARLRWRSGDWLDATRRCRCFSTGPTHIRIIPTTQPGA